MPVRTNKTNTVRTRITNVGVVQELVDTSAGSPSDAATLTIEVPHVGSANTVVWAPFAEYTGLPAGAVATWAEAVAAVNKMGPVETTIQIVTPEGFPLWWWSAVVIPGGEWNLNNTLISGPTPEGADTYYSGDWGGDDMPWRNRLYVETEDNPSNPCRINGCRGLKNLHFRGNQEVRTNLTAISYLPEEDDVSCVYVNDTSIFRVNQQVMVGDKGEGSDSYAGIYYVVAVDAEEGCITLYNNGNGLDGATINPVDTWYLYPDTSVFSFSPFTNNGWWDHPEFLLSNVELRHYDWGWNDKWGVVRFDFNVHATLVAEKESYIRASSISTDADELNVVTRDKTKIRFLAVRNYDDNTFSCNYTAFFIGAGSKIVEAQESCDHDFFYPYIQS